MIRNLCDAFGRGDIPTILNMLADDVDWYDPGRPAVTHAGRYRGRDDVLRFFSRVGESLAIETFEPKEFIAKGDRVTYWQVYEDRARELAAHAPAGVCRAHSGARWSSDGERRAQTAGVRLRSADAPRLPGTRRRHDRDTRS
jgi:hypothetical protein